jgi:hypothetical protein
MRPRLGPASFDTHRFAMLFRMRVKVTSMPNYSLSSAMAWTWRP